MTFELLGHIELILGSIGVVLGIFFALFLITNWQKQPRANLFLSVYLLAFSLRIGKSLFHNYFEIDATLRTFILTTLLCVGPSIWLYALNLIKSETKNKNYIFFHFIPFLILASISWLIPNNGSWIFGIFYNFLIAHMFCYIIFSLLWLKKQKNTKTIKENNKLKNWLNFFLILNLILVVMYFLISELIFLPYIALSFLFSIVIILLSFWALKNPFLFQVSSKKYKNSTINRNDAFRLIVKLKNLMDEEKPYLNPSLNLSELSTKLSVSTKELSQVINQTESLNYSQFISKYRIEEVKCLMKSPTYSKMTIAAIAYDCGFNSISTFNTAFKKHSGSTAISYRKSVKIN